MKNLLSAALNIRAVILSKKYLVTTVKEAVRRQRHMAIFVLFRLQLAVGFG
jgi:hypothetical protein